MYTTLYYTMLSFPLKPRKYLNSMKYILKTIIIPLTLPLYFIIHNPQACTHVDYLCFIDVEANCTAGSP